MFTHCLSCETRLPVTGVLDRSVRGDRIAYDPERGRLWSICRTCGSWNIVPIQERWETLEALERVVTREPGRATRARLLSQTENINLYELGQLRIVRVGRTNLLEEAWWRYGQQLHTRWHNEQRITVGLAATMGAAIVGGVLSATLPARYAFRSPQEVRRWLTFGERAWSGHKTCSRCGHVIRELSFFDRRIIMLRREEEGEPGPALARRCPRCRDSHGGGLQLSGAEAAHTLRRVLAFEHHPAVPEPQIRDALGLIERAGDPAKLAGVLARHTNQLGDLPPEASVALEVAVNEARERELLKLEAHALEQYWREAEELASIVDGELTPGSGIERLRRKAVGGI